MPDVSERLATLLSFDPAKEVAAGNEVLAEALKEIKEERVKAAKVKAKEQMLKAIELRTQMMSKKREFDAQWKKFEKELGKIVGRLEAMSQGKSLEAIENEEKEKEEKEKTEA